MTRSFTRRSHPARRLPGWLRRGVRAWVRCSRWASAHLPRRARGACIEIDVLAEDEGDSAAAEERRCGWFDSSQDLREGLCISEHGNADPVVAQLPVMAWVQLQLSGWRPGLEA